VVDLRSQVNKLQQTNQNLVRDLNLTSKLAQSRKVPYYSNDEFSSLIYLKYALYALLSVGFCLLLKRTNLERNYYDL
jgi:hypothetical protein